MRKRPKKPQPNARPKRLFLTGLNWYWKPETRLRQHFRSVALGDNATLAEQEARRLNTEVAAWLRENPDPLATPRRKMRAGPITVSGLASAYRASEKFRGLAASSRKTAQGELRRLETEFGHEIAGTLDSSRVDDWADSLRRSAPQRLRHDATRGHTLFQWARRKKLILRSDNPFAALDLPAPGRRKQHFAWEDVQAVVAAADAAGRPSVGTALIIAFCCVQRLTDVVALQRRAIVATPTGPRLQFRQSKTGFDVDMALPPIVAQRLMLAPPIGTKQGFLIVSEETLAAYREDNIARVYRALRDGPPRKNPADPRRGGVLPAHLQRCQLRDGRRSGFVRYIMDGASVPFVCSMSGHTIDEGMQIVETYLPKTPGQADAAVKLLSVKL